MDTIRYIDQALLNQLREQAAASPRRRTHHCLHDNNEAAIHRLVVAAEPGTRVRPHRHLTGDKWELLLPLCGQCDILIFAADGTLRERVELRPGGTVPALELSAGVWHSFVVMEPGSAFMEVKPGPYLRPEAGDWAPWAPDENDPAAVAYEQWCRCARPGERYGEIAGGKSC